LYDAGIGPRDLHFSGSQHHFINDYGHQTRHLCLEDHWLSSQTKLKLPIIIIIIVYYEEQDLYPIDIIVFEVTKGNLTYRFFPRETSYVRLGVGLQL
jgi:hypothetical protein